MDRVGSVSHRSPIPSTIVRLRHFQFVTNRLKLITTEYIFLLGGRVTQVLLVVLNNTNFDMAVLLINFN